MQVVMQLYCSPPNIGLRIPKPLNQWQKKDVILDRPDKIPFRYCILEVRGDYPEIKYVKALATLHDEDVEKLYEKSLTANEFLTKLENIERQRISG